jgi:ABC-type Fe3+ transport system permease subunit/DNA-binding beta-propeller fold protein YncE
MNWTLFQNSMWVAGLATLLSVAFGLIAALWLSGLEPRWRARWLAVSVVALCLPPFLVTNCWMYYLGHTGVWRSWLPLNIYSLGGTVWILTLLTWPITLLSVLGAWRRLEPSQLESDPLMTGPALLRGLLLPLARGALAQAAVLTFVLTLNNFSVPAILQEKVYPAEVWVRFNTTFDVHGALEMCWPMVVTPLLLLVWFRRREIAWPRLDGPVSASVFRRQLGTGWFWFCGVCTVTISLLATGLPLAQLASASRTWIELPAAIAAGQSALWNSFLFAAAAATLCLALGLIGWRLPLGTALWLPFLVPGVLMGIGLIEVFNRPLFSAFYQSAGIVILAYCIRYLAFGWNGAAQALRGVDRDLTDAARLDGASRWQMLRHVHWPQISPQLAAAWYLIFLLCLWDVESIVLVVPPGGETLALRVFNLLHYGHNPQVNAICLALLALAVAPLVLWHLGRFFVERKRAGAMAMAVAALAILPGCSQNNSREASLDSKLFSRVEIIGTRGVGVGEFNKPRSLTVDRQDNLYVVDITGRVQKFSPDGKFILSWQMHPEDLVKPKGEPKGMGVDRAGNIIVVEPHYQRLNLFTTDGKQLEQWGQRGTNAGQFIMPRAVAVTTNGDYLVPEYSEVDRIQEFSGRDKKLIKVIGHAGSDNGNFDRAEGICLDEEGRLYVADSCNHRIQVFSADGKWLRSYGKAGSGPGEFSYPYDIRVDAAGRQYVCEFANSRIQVFDANDRPLEIIGGPGAKPGQFSNPWSIAFDSAGDLYVADSQNHRVQKLIRRKDVAMR